MTPVLVAAVTPGSLRPLRLVVALGDTGMIPHKAVIWVKRAGILGYQLVREICVF